VRGAVSYQCKQMDVLLQHHAATWLLVHKVEVGGGCTRTLQNANLASEADKRLV
jgi:hypothetical protein